MNIKYEMLKGLVDYKCLFKDNKQKLFNGTRTCIQFTSMWVGCLPSDNINYTSMALAFVGAGLFTQSLNAMHNQKHERLASYDKIDAMTQPDKPYLIDIEHQLMDQNRREQAQKIRWSDTLMGAGAIAGLQVVNSYRNNIADMVGADENMPDPTSLAFYMLMPLVFLPVVSELASYVSVNRKEKSFTKKRDAMSTSLSTQQPKPL